MADMRIAVISDIHAGDEGSEWTHVRIEPPAARLNQHPLTDLRHLIKKNELRAEYLVVPGDLANRADPEGLAYAWRQLHSIAGQLDARLLSAPGNHDVVTHDAIGDPRSILKNLLPTFPTGDVSLDEHFWREGWCSIEEADHRIVIIDSTSGFPQFPSGATKRSLRWRTYKQHIDRGSVTDSIERGLETYVSSLTDSRTNIAIIHHHPQEHQLRDYLQDGYGPMFRGGELLEIFTRYPRGGRWIVIHGHKHVPQLANAISSSSNGPLVLCAASAGAELWSPVNTVTRNQFHILTASNKVVAGVGSLCGTVDSFTWGFGDGWSVSERRGSGLPGHSGFGCAIDSATLADQTAAVMNDGQLEFLPYSDLKRMVPQLPYQLPRDFEAFEDELEYRGFGFDRDRYERITQLSRKQAP